MCFQIENADNLKEVEPSKINIYQHTYSYKEMEDALSDAANQELDKLISDSPFIGLMVDETTDISVYKKLIIYLKLTINGRAAIVFGGNVEVPDGKSNTVFKAICDFIKQKTIPVEKIVGFASDGASVMVGRVNGVCTQLKDMNPLITSVHCIAHKLALAAATASTKIPYLVQYKRTINQVYNFYQYSAVRYNKIRELKKALKTKAKKFQQPSSVRWLSVYNSIDVIIEAWPILVMALEHEVEVNKVPEAKGILKEVGTYKFLATSCFLKDVLFHINKLSKVFQRDTINISVMKDTLQTTKSVLLSLKDQDGDSLSSLHKYLEDSNGEFHGVKLKRFNEQDKKAFKSLKLQYIEKLINGLDNRFPPQDTDILSCLNAIFNPKLLPDSAAAIRDYGKDELERLVTFYGVESESATVGRKALINAKALKDDFLHFKYFLNSNRTLSVEQICEILLNHHEYQDQYPEFIKLSQIFMAIPISSVPCERGFSNQNRVKNKLRNRLGIERVEGTRGLCEQSVLS